MQAIANQAAISIEHTTLLEKSFEMQEALQVRELLDQGQGAISCGPNGSLKRRGVQADSATEHGSTQVHAEIAERFCWRVKSKTGQTKPG